MVLPKIMNGDHAEFEQEWAGKDPKTRPDWPLPSFDAKDWAEAFCKELQIVSREAARPVDDQMGVMISWFANALIRGWDEHGARSARSEDTGPQSANLRSLLDEALALLEVGDEANTPGTDTYTFIVTAKEALRAKDPAPALTTSEA